MEIIENKLVNGRQSYKIRKDKRVFEGRLWIRNFWKHEGGYSAFVFIGKECLGRLYINELGILFNLKQISEYNKIWCKEATIKKHLRKAVIENFTKISIETKIAKPITKRIKKRYNQTYFDNLKAQANFLTEIVYGS